MPETWTNWARQQHCAPERIARPGSEEELSELVAGARAVRAVGSGHSFTDIACTDGLMVDMSRMGRVLSVEGEDVTVEAGVTLHALGEELAARGLALENQGDIDAQTLAGALSTGTHGTGARFGNLSSRVVGMRIVTGSGEPVDVRGGDELLAARVGLGALGVISRVTVRCVPAFTIHRVDEPRPLDDVLPRLDALVDGADHFEAFVFPYTRTALTLTSERTEREPRPRSRLAAAAQELILENAVLGASVRAGRAAPRAIPRLNRLLTRAAHPHRVPGCQPPRVRQRAPRALHGDGVRDPARAGGRGAGAGARDDRAPPASDRVPDRATGDGRRTTRSCPPPRGERPPTSRSTSTGAWSSRPTSGRWRRSWTSTAAGRTGASATTSRPHTLAPRYPGWERFQAVRRRFDPEGRFANDYTNRVLGPVSP